MSQGNIEVDGITRTYGDFVALDDLTMTIDQGEILGFVGPNGAGKTTAMRIIVGLLEADSGQVLWGGSPVGRGQRRQFGYMPEERGLYPKMRVDQQLSYFAELHGLSPTAAAEQTTSWLERLGIADRAEDSVEELSLGNQQRVQLAASLVFEPDALVLDEPFSGLDPVGVDVLSEVILEVCREREVPVIFSSHQLELVERICDSVAIIKGGKLVASGPVAELERERSGNAWRLRLAGSDENWDPGLAGVRRKEAWVFDLEPQIDPQALLDAGREAGEVVEFGQQVPGLSELFRKTIEEDR